jgi:hypothetical protein
MGHPASTLVYYGEVKGYGVVFVRHPDACRLARIHWAVDSSATWGEFSAKVPLEVMDDLLQQQGRVSFHEFCRIWLYQALGWQEQDALNWFRDCIEAYRSLEAYERYPLPEEECWASDARADGSWPEMPQRLVLDWCPREIVSEFGERRVPLHEFPYVYFDPSQTRAITARLKTCGFELVRADVLIRIACGCTPYELGSEVTRSVIEAVEQHKVPSEVHQKF